MEGAVRRAIRAGKDSVSWTPQAAQMVQCHQMQKVRGLAEALPHPPPGNLHLLSLPLELLSTGAVHSVPCIQSYGFIRNIRFPRFAFSVAWVSPSLLSMAEQHAIAPFIDLSIRPGYVGGFCGSVLMSGAAMNKDQSNFLFSTIFNSFGWVCTQ